MTNYGAPSCSALPTMTGPNDGYFTFNEPPGYAGGPQDLQVWTTNKIVFNDSLNPGESTPIIKLNGSTTFMWAGTWYRLKDALDLCGVPETTTTTQPETTTSTTAPTTTTTTTTAPTTTTTTEQVTTTTSPPDPTTTTSTPESTTSTTAGTTSTTSAPGPDNLGEESQPYTCRWNAEVKRFEEWTPGGNRFQSGQECGVETSVAQAPKMPESRELAYTGDVTGLLVGAGVLLSTGGYALRRLARRMVSC